jgi:hypothetical protein
MFRKIIDFILRFTLCTFTFHKPEDTKVQSHREYDIYACARCGNLFGTKKEKYKK